MIKMKSHVHAAAAISDRARDHICQNVADGLGDGVAIDVEVSPGVMGAFNGTAAWQELRASVWLKITRADSGKSGKRLVQIPFKAKLVNGDGNGPALINEKRLERDFMKVCGDLIPKYIEDLKMINGQEENANGG